MHGIRVDDIWSPFAQSLLRMVAGAMLLQHGLASLPGLGALRGSGPLPAPIPGLGASVMVELIGGALLLVGLLTRPVALICCASAIATYLSIYAPRGLWPMQNGGELAALYSFVFLYLTFAGAGPWSLDARGTPTRLPGAAGLGDGGRQGGRRQGGGRADRNKADGNRVIGDRANGDRTHGDRTILGHSNMCQGDWVQGDWVQGDWGQGDWGQGNWGRGTLAPESPDAISPSAWRTTFGRAQPGAR